MDRKLGIYLCSGCGISDAVDMEKLEKVATVGLKAATCAVHPFLCGKEGAAKIAADVKDGVNTVVIAACSPRVMYDVFDYGTQVVLERVNIREHVAWSQPGAEKVTEPAAEGSDAAPTEKIVFNGPTQMMAADYLRIGQAKAMKAEPPEPFKQESDEDHTRGRRRRDRHALRAGRLADGI